MSCKCDKIKNSTDDYVIAWRAWYDLGSKDPVEYNSNDHTLHDLPDDGFQGMKLWFSDGTSRYISGNDFYFFCQHEAGIIFGQSNDTLRDIKKRYPKAMIKRGRHVPDIMIKQINDLMITAKNPLDASS